MRNISKEEHLELMAFLSDKAFQLYAHEVKMAIQKGQEPKNVYQGIFNIQQCGALDRSNDTTYYVVFTRSFLNLTRKFIPELTEKEPDVFINRDANYILEKLNVISGYSKFNKDAKDFLKYISNETCVYVVAKVDGIFEDKVLRADLCRGVRYIDSQRQEFYGGLLHAAKHFHISDINAVDSTYDLERLLSLSMLAYKKILPDKDKKVYSICLPYDNKHSLQFSFYKEEFTNVYYINTIYPVRNSAVETFYSNNQFGLKNSKDGVIVPCRYDDIAYEENANCYICKRDGKYAEDYWSRSYSGVMDMYSSIGELLFGGFDDYHYLSNMDMFLFRFGGYSRRRWIMVDRKMKSIWGHANFYGKVISIGPNKEVDLPEEYTFEDYLVLNDSLVTITKAFNAFWPEYLICNIVFVKEHTLQEHDWYYHICDNIVLYVESDKKLGLTNGIYSTEAKYDYITKPYKGWCIGIARYDSNTSNCYCELINICNIEVEPILLYQGIYASSFKEFVQNNWALVCDISEVADKSIKEKPIIYVPEQLYKSNFVNTEIRNIMACGSPLKSAENKFEYLSPDILIEDKEKYINRVHPKPNYSHFSGRVSPLDAFEGDEELYAKWLDN